MRARYWIALASVLLLALWSTGRMDPVLSNVGLNRNDCVQNGFGAKFCGDAAEQYQRNVAEAKAESDRIMAEAQAEMARAQAEADASAAQAQAEMDAYLKQAQDEMDAYTP